MTTQTTNTTSAAPQASLAGGLGQISSGPAGILYTIAAEMNAIYNKLVEAYNQMTQSQIDVQRATVTAASDTQIAAANNRAAGITSQAVGSLAGAAATLGGFAYERFGLNELNTKLTGQEKDLATLNEIKAMPHNPNPVVGDGNAIPNEAALSQRARDLKNGIFTQPGDTPASVQAAINELHPDAYTQMREKLEKQIPRLEKKINQTQTEISTMTQRIQQGTQLLSGGASGIAQGVQATYTAKEGENEAARTVTAQVAQQAGGAADNTRSQLAQIFNKESEAINAAAQGSKTYAQT